MIPDARDSVLTLDCAVRIIQERETREKLKKEKAEVISRALQTSMC
jgi:hypothetical protein